MKGHSLEKVSIAVATIDAEGKKWISYHEHYISGALFIPDGTPIAFDIWYAAPHKKKQLIMHNISFAQLLGTPFYKKDVKRRGKKCKSGILSHGVKKEEGR
jgi:hypothetical protein